MSTLHRPVDYKLVGTASGSSRGKGKGLFELLTLIRLQDGRFEGLDDLLPGTAEAQEFLLLLASSSGFRTYGTGHAASARCRLRWFGDESSLNAAGSGGSRSGCRVVMCRRRQLKSAPLPFSMMETDPAAEEVPVAVMPIDVVLMGGRVGGDGVGDGPASRLRGARREAHPFGAFRGRPGAAGARRHGDASLASLVGEGLRRGRDGERAGRRRRAGAGGGGWGAAPL